MVRIVLTLLVALNLIFICWGHDEWEHYTDIHLTFLGEPEHEAYGAGSTAYPTPGRSLVVYANRLPESALLVMSFLTNTQAASLATSNSQGGHSVETLGIAPVLVAATAVLSSRYLSRTESSRLRVQIALPPLVPPPRKVHLWKTSS